MIGIAALISGFYTYTTYQDADKRINEFRKKELTAKKQGLIDSVGLVCSSIESQMKKAKDWGYIKEQYGPALKNVIDTCEAFIDSLRAQVKAGKLSTEEAQTQAKDFLRKFRYNKSGYIWINDTGTPFPKMIMHPTAPALDGKVLDMEKFNCALGKKENLFKAMVDVCRDNNEGFVDYVWPKPGKDGLQPKLSYVRKIKDWDWILGTGIYVDDAIDDAKKDIKSMVKGMRYGKT